MWHVFFSTYKSDFSGYNDYECVFDGLVEAVRFAKKHAEVCTPAVFCFANKRTIYVSV